MFNRRTELIALEGNLNGQMYAENIIRAIIYPLRDEMGEHFIFMDDNARPHRTQRVQQVLNEGNIERLDWPANSPDMNPIEHVWDYVQRRIHQRDNPPITLEELRIAAQEEWNNIPQETINNLIISMHRRVNLLFQRRGRHTDY